jgi:hypothetical protein
VNSGPEAKPTWPAVTLTAGLVVSALAGCGGGAPRRPEPPERRQPSGARETFEVRGTKDTWDEPLPILHALKSMGGVHDAWVDEATGKYVVAYDPRRTTREEIDRCVRDVGRDQGRYFEPIFDSR